VSQKNALPFCMLAHQQSGLRARWGVGAGPAASIGQLLKTAAVTPLLLLTFVVNSNCKRAPLAFRIPQQHACRCLNTISITILQRVLPCWLLGIDALSTYSWCMSEQVFFLYYGWCLGVSVLKDIWSTGPGEVMA
jgi:hypothetical protein